MTSINEIANKILTGEITVDKAVDEYAAALTKEVNVEKTKREEEEKKKEEKKARIAEQRTMEANRKAQLCDIIDHTLDFLQHYFPDFIPVSFELTKEETAEIADEIIAEIETEVARMKPYKQFFSLLGKDTATSNDKEPKRHTVFSSNREEDLFNDLVNKLFGTK